MHLKGICHSLFVITRTQLNLNKIVISKQYKESHNGSHVRKGTKPASIVLKIIQSWKKFIPMIMPQWISQYARYVQSDRDSFHAMKSFQNTEWRNKDMLIQNHNVSVKSCGIFYAVSRS